MNDTISREDATRYFIGLQALDKITNDNYDGKITFEEVIYRLGVIPSVGLDVIQCKDCKHIRKWRSEESAKKFGQVYECAISVLGCPKPQDFCSYAERRV